jgi:N6-adenosine-specific RNA methylase IME4
MTLEFPDKKYNIIYADPPWKYDENWGNGVAEHNYNVLPFNEIKKLPIQKITDKNCHLYLWYTNSFVKEAHELCEAWGFKYKQTLTWVKLYSNNKLQTGMGYYFRGTTEHILFGVKGKLPRLRKDLINLIETKGHAVYEKNLHFGEHSKKPNKFRDIIVKHSGDLPRIELFARTKIHGWDVWGNDQKLQNQPLENF